MGPLLAVTLSSTLEYDRVTQSFPRAVSVVCVPTRWSETVSEKINSNENVVCDLVRNMGLNEIGSLSQVFSGI